MPTPSFDDHPRCYRCPCTVEHKLAGIRHDDRRLSTAMATPAERKEEKRRLALEELERQKKDGSLVTRKMTPAERKKYPARPPRESRGSSR
jgi:hypothetical protein